MKECSRAETVKRAMRRGARMESIKANISLERGIVKFPRVLLCTLPNLEIDSNWLNFRYPWHLSLCKVHDPINDIMLLARR